MNASEIIKNIETAQLKAEVPEFRVEKRLFIIPL